MDETNPVRNALYQFKLKQDRLSKDLDELERRRANDPKLLDISLNAIVETARITTDFIRRQEREKGSSLLADIAEGQKRIEEELERLKAASITPESASLPKRQITSKKKRGRRAPPKDGVKKRNYKDDWECRQKLLYSKWSFRQEEVAYICSKSPRTIHNKIKSPKFPNGPLERNEAGGITQDSICRFLKLTPKRRS